MNRFFNHDTATPPASWWSAEAAGRFLDAPEAREEAAMHALSPQDMMADVIGHDISVAAMPLLLHADLDEETRHRFSDAVARMISPEALQALANRQLECTRSRLCPAGLLFAPPRTGITEASSAQAPKLEPLDFEVSDPPPGLDPWVADLLTAALFNLAGRPERARRVLQQCREEQAGDPRAAALLRKEREVADLLLGEANGYLTYGYHRVLANVLGRHALTCDQLAEAVESLDAKSPWRWASLRMSLPVLLDEAPDRLARLMSEDA